MDEQSKIRWLRLLSRMPLLSVANLSDCLLMGTDRVRRMTDQLIAEGLVVCAHIGMAEQRQARFWVSRAGLDYAYETGHIHPTERDLSRIKRLETNGKNATEVEDFWRACDFSHQHDVFGDEDENDHVHPPWPATEEGVWWMMQHLSRAEAVYREAPAVLRTGALQPEMPAAAKRKILWMTDFSWIKNGRLYDAKTQYGDDVMVVFTVVGSHVTDTQLAQKRDRSLQNLIIAYEPPGRNRRMWDRHDPDGPPFVPSAHVVIAADAMAMDVASRTVPNAAIRCADGSRCGSWTYQSSFHRIGERLKTWPVVGQPERILERLIGSKTLTAVLDKPNHRLLMTIAIRPGNRSSDLGVVAAVANAKKAECLRKFEEARLVFPWRGRYYLDQLGMRLVARINRVSPSSITHRFERYLNESFREHEHRHDDGVNALAARFKRIDVVIEPGWRRMVHHAYGRTQVRPDAWVYVERGPLGTGWHAIEYELSARSPSKMDKKCRPYRMMAQSGAPIPLLFICATDRAEANVLNVAGGLPVMTCTVDRANHGALAGAETVWRHGGRAIALDFRCAPRRRDTRR